MKNRNIKWTLDIVILLLVFALFSCSQKTQKQPIRSSTLNVPVERSINWDTDSELNDSMIRFWSRKTIEYGPKKGKVDNPRILLAKLHSKTNVAETNKIIMGMTPWGISGSSWWLNPLGDYGCF